MGLLKRKVTEPTAIEPTKLKGMPSEDVYLLIESNLMEAQYTLTQYRQGDDAVRGAILNWMKVSLDTASLGCQELSSRNT